MSGAVEAVYIFDQDNKPILEHVFCSKPPAPVAILSSYLEHPKPRPPVIYLPNAVPSSVVFSLEYSSLLFLCPSSLEVDSLLPLEFLHRLIDILEDFLGSPLLASKMEGNYDVVSQLLGEMCDGGIINNTEPNALKEAVDMPGWVGKLLGNVSIPGSSISSQSANAMSLHNPTLKPQSTGPALPWRRANVRHTSNEIYVDVIEELFVTLAPSGRPLSAFANGAIAFNSKLSGVPDISLILSTPGGRSGIEGALSLPVFHPCVRLARWRDSPGELSFVPPDGRFVLAGYEVDLLPPPSKGPKFSSNIQLPVFVEVRIGLGSLGSEFEVRLSISTPVSGSATPTSSYAGRGGFGSRLGTSSPAFSGSTNIPLITGILVSIPLPDGVRNITDIRPTRGEAQYLPSESKVEWRVSPKEIRTGKTVAGSTLRCTVTGHFTGPGEDIAMAKSTTTEEYDYKEDGYQQGQMKTEGSKAVEQSEELGDLQNQRYAMLMPSSVNVSFSVKGWLASGLRVDSLSINASASRGLGEGVKPYKGLKYLTVSRNGLEVRC